MTREDHLQWCKDRALEYVGMGELQNALTSMYSDLGKHEETKEHIGIELGIELQIMKQLNTPGKIRKFIEGFN